MRIQIDLFGVEVAAGISAVRAYLERIEQQLQEAIDAAEKEFQEKRKQLMNEIDLEFAYQDYWNLRENLVRFFRYSYVMLLFSLVEKWLGVVLSDTESRHSLPLKANDIKGTKLERSKTYLGKLVGVQVTSLKGWPSLCLLNHVRDCIVHTGGTPGRAKRQSTSRIKMANSKGIRLRAVYTSS